ncbi:MAG: hypothetical protein CVU41_02145 [Chloroflexi bacterium HGW-Chloroflexi-3]|nr:MAG: hypothetical protein CVU41_02145 [Chloroflexi bacterium HGW-Chloroflexi-3]
MKKVFLYLFLIGIFLSLAACNLTKQFGNPSDPSTVSTLAMQTVQALATEQAFSTMVANATEVSNLPTIIVVEQTSPIQNTPVTPEVVQPTNTPLPTFTQMPMDKATFVKDVTYPDNTVIASSTTFKKTWRLKNDGQTTWTADYELIFSSGNAMEGNATNKIGVNVKPGETIDLSIDLKSPTNPGEYKGEWMLRTPGGKIFGVGEKADKAFWVIIKVENYQSEGVPSEIYPLDFVAKICNAQWKSNYSVVRIPCDTDKSMTKAYVAVLLKPKLENGYLDDERTIHMHLDGESGSWIQGYYPALLIKDGAYFSAVVGCLDGSKSCNVTISLEARIDGGNPVNLGKWVETYDEKITKIEIDLSSYAGKNVEFILGISNRSNVISDVFWLAPRVVQ